MQKSLSQLSYTAFLRTDELSGANTRLSDTSRKLPAIIGLNHSHHPYDMSRTTEWAVPQCEKVHIMA